MDTIHIIIDLCRSHNTVEVMVMDCQQEEVCAKAFQFLGESKKGGTNTHLEELSINSYQPGGSYISQINIELP